MEDGARDQVEAVALRGEAWWHDPKNSLRLALDKIDIPTSLRLWIGDVAVQAWTEGAITAVQEYGDELRDMEAAFDDVLSADMSAVIAWRAAHPGNNNVLPDMAKLLEWLVSEAAKNG